MSIFVQFGAGNIGRSFVGKLFALSGYDTVFVDVNVQLVRMLNERNTYCVVVKRDNVPDESIMVGGVRGISASDHAAVADEVANATYVATSVGLAALASVFPLIAEGLALRRERRPHSPLDIIIAENIGNGADLFRAELTRLLPDDYPFDDFVGLVETSIGKMAPMVGGNTDLPSDPLTVFCEAYDELIVHRNAFKNVVPNISSVKAVENIGAYVARKLFIHNLGHAAAAYFGYAAQPDSRYIWQVLENMKIIHAVHSAMEESANAVRMAFPNEFTARALEEHIDDLITRFKNRSLGDTVYRVGRDLYRKLQKKDRLVGAMLLAERMGVGYRHIALATVAATRFGSVDETGRTYSSDRKFIDDEVPKGLSRVLSDVCGLSLTHPVERQVIMEVLGVASVEVRALTQ